MSKLSKELALSVGGNLWEKNELTRVYLSLSAIDSLLVNSGYKSGLVASNKKTLSAKTFLDVKTGVIHSDVGLIRSSLNSCGFGCEK